MVIQKVKSNLEKENVLLLFLSDAGKIRIRSLYYWIRIQEAAQSIKLSITVPYWLKILLEIMYVID